MTDTRLTVFPRQLVAFFEELEDLCRDYRVSISAKELDLHDLDESTIERFINQLREVAEAKR